MDYETQLQNARQKLSELGFSEEKYNQLMELAAEEIMDTALADLQEKNLEALEELENNLVAEPNSIEEANTNIRLIFSAAYGEQAEDTKQKMLLEYLNMTIQETVAAKDLLQRYQAGDPTAIAVIEANKDNPDAQELAKYIEEQQATGV